MADATMVLVLVSVLIPSASPEPLAGLRRAYAEEARCETVSAGLWAAQIARTVCLPVAPPVEADTH